MPSLKKNVLYAFGTKGVGIIFSFLATVFLTRLLGPEFKGVHAYINANVDLIVTLLSFQTGSTLTYFLAKEEVDKEKIVGLSILINVIGFLVLLLLLLIPFGKFTFQSILLPENYTSQFFILYFLILFIGKLNQRFTAGVWQGLKKFNYLNFTIVLLSVLQFVIFGSVYYYGQYNNISFGIKELFSFILVIQVIMLLARTVLYGIFSKQKISFNVRSVVRPVLLFSLFVGGSAILSFLVRRIDIWFVEYFRGIEAVGYYSLAAVLVTVFNLVFIPAISVISPYLTEANLERQQEIIGRISRILTTISLLIAILLIFISDYFIVFVYGPIFSESILPMKILSISLVFLILQNVFAIYNIATNNLRPNLVGNGLALLITIAFNFLLVPKYGIIGASITSLLAYFIGCFYMFYSVHLKLRLNFSQYFLLNKSDIKFALAVVNAKLK